MRPDHTSGPLAALHAAVKRGTPIVGIPSTPYGYDGIALQVGDRVELHPATDLWMRGARYGTILRFSLTPNDRVHFTLDAFPDRKTPFAAPADLLRKV